MRKLTPGLMVTTNFDNEFIRLWHVVPRTTDVSKSEPQPKDKITQEEERTRENRSMGPIWSKGSCATILERTESWIRIMTHSGPGWISEWNVEVVE